MLKSMGGSTTTKSSRTIRDSSEGTDSSGRTKNPFNYYAGRGVGGVMADYSWTVNGRRTNVSWDKNGNTLTTVQSVGSFNTTLDNVVSVKGDHKRPNPHRYRRVYFNYGSGSVVNTNSNGSGTSSTGPQAVATAFVDTFHDQTSFVYNKNLSKVYDKIRGEVDLSVDGFQAKQAGVMINHRFAQARQLFVKAAPEALWAIGGLYSMLKRSRPRDWGSLRLEWVYGWKPLADSVYGAMENMIVSSSKSGNEVRGHPVNSRSSEMGDRRVEFTRSGAGNAITRTRQYNSLYKNRIVAFYALTTGGLNNVATYTSLNPVSIAWELVPYSFVADWFLDVGGYLRNMESGLLYGSDFVNGYQSALAIERYDETVGGVEDLGGGSQSITDGSGCVYRTRFQRSVFGSSPLPRPPSFNPKLGTDRLLNAAALLSQQLHGLKKMR